MISSDWRDTFYWLHVASAGILFFFLFFLPLVLLRGRNFKRFFLFLEKKISSPVIRTIKIELQL